MSYILDAASDYNSGRMSFAAISKYMIRYRILVFPTLFCFNLRPFADILNIKRINISKRYIHSNHETFNGQLLLKSALALTLRFVKWKNDVAIYKDTDLLTFRL